MRSLIFVLFILLMPFSSCSPQKKTKKIIEKDKMVEVLVDCYLVETFISRKFPEDGEEKQKNTQILYNEVFEKYDITPEEFRESYAYYIAHHKEMKEIYEDVVAVLNAQ